MESWRGSKDKAKSYALYETWMSPVRRRKGRNRAFRVEEFDLVEINIAEDLVLYERYKHDIPVVLIDDVEAFRHRLTAREFLHALRQNS